MTVIENLYGFGDLVYLKTDEDQKQRMVTGFRVCPSGVLIYYLSYGASVSEHYEFEIIEEVNIMKRTTD